MKTLLQINTNVGWNATGRCTEDLGRCVLEAGWKSYIAYGRDMNGPTMSASNLIKVGSRFDNYKHGLLTRVLDRHGLGSIDATRSLIRKIDQLNPSIIHLHNIHGYYLNYEELFGYLARSNKPVVWTMHDCWPFTGHCAYFTPANCSRWKHGCHSCPLQHDYPASSLADNSADNFSRKKAAFTSVPNLHIVTVSEHMNQVLQESFLGKFPIYTIYNNVQLPPYVPKDNNNPIVLAVASKWEYRKGLAYITELRRLLPADIKIRIIGLTPGQINSLPEGCEGVPRINEREQLQNEYAKASVFINPSIADSLAVVNLEATAAGTPIVVFDSGGMRETVSPESGILVKSGDVAAMAQAVLKILSHPEQYTASKCRKFVTEKFSPSTNLGMYLDLYESLLPYNPQAMTSLPKIPVTT